MDEKAARHIGSGIAWLGFWLMLGFANFGEAPSVTVMDQTVEAVKDAVSDSYD